MLRAPRVQTQFWCFPAMWPGASSLTSLSLSSSSGRLNPNSDVIVAKFKTKSCKECTQLQGPACSSPQNCIIICPWVRAQVPPSTGIPQAPGTGTEEVRSPGQGKWKRHRAASVHTQCPCCDGWVLSGHQPRDLIKLVMNPNMSLGSQELSLVSSACRLILVFPSFFFLLFPPPLLHPKE